MPSGHLSNNKNSIALQINFACARFLTPLFKVCAQHLHACRICFFRWHRYTSACCFFISFRSLCMSEFPCSHCGRFLLFKSVCVDRPYCLNAKCVTNHMTFNPVLRQIQISFECEPTQLDSSSSDILGSECSQKTRCIDESQGVCHPDTQDSSVDACRKEHVTETTTAEKCQLRLPDGNFEKPVSDNNPIESSNPVEAVSEFTRTLDNLQTAERADTQDPSLHAGRRQPVFQAVTSASFQGWSPKRNCDKMLADRDPIESSAPGTLSSSSRKISHGALKSSARRKETEINI